MALAAPVIRRCNGLLDLLRQKVPVQDRAVELYRRLLAVDELAASMNAAKDVEQLQQILAGYPEWLPGDSIRLCLVDGTCYRRSRLTGAGLSEDEGSFPLEHGIVGKVLQTGAPFMLSDTTSPTKWSEGWPPVEHPSHRSLIVLPFAALGRVIGALEMVSTRHNRFDEIDYHLGVLVAAHLSSSLDNILTRQELAAANARLRDNDQRLTELNRQLQQLAHTDDLTGLFNKRRLVEQLEAEVARARRYGEILSCLMIDIDNFKQVNDCYGHQAGDEVLRQVGSLLRQRLRVTDFVARYGGEEFTVLLPRTDGSGACRVSENLRKYLRTHLFVLPTTTLRLTVSIGIACCTKFDRIDSQQVIVRADSALYRAKRTGKDKVCFSEEAEN